MILTSIQDLSRYVNVHPNLKTAIDFLQNTDLGALTGEKIEVDGDKVFIKLANTKLLTPEDAKFEVHNKYLDIQIPLSASETFGWGNRKELKAPKGEFDEKKDLLFFADKPTTYVTVLPGECIIFFPEDAHAPLVGEGNIQKVIVKVAI
jgi:biofilm protein TabA